MLIPVGQLWKVSLEHNVKILTKNPIRKEDLEERKA